MEIDEMKSIRMEKIAALKAKGINPYGRRFQGAVSIESVLADFEEEKDVILAGRVMANRKHGKVYFMDLQDKTGRMQLFIKADNLTEEQFDLVKEIDIGDIIGVKGQLFVTKTGQQSVRILDYTLLSKALNCLPEKKHGLKDVEIRYRQRYVDLIANTDVRDVFIKRSHIVRMIRTFLDDRGFLEVETPILQTLAGGARGKPFASKHNAYDMDVFLRIAPELFLKRLLVGGLERVYEMNRNFRNEGVSTRHNPEFTMLEVYQAYGNFEDMMELTETLVSFLAKEITGSYKVNYQGREIDFTTPWERRSFAQIVKDKFDIDPGDDAPAMMEKVQKVKGSSLKVDKLTKSAVMNIVEEMLEEDKITNPVFLTDYFTFLCPLAKTLPDNPLISQRFEVFVAGMEIGNAYTELNDPIEQRKRLVDDLDDDVETGNRSIDEDFLNALEYGMPPAGGLGIGIDRLVMLLTDAASIRDVILFPLMKPIVHKSKEDSDADESDESEETEVAEEKE